MHEFRSAFRKDIERVSGDGDGALAETITPASGPPPSSCLEEELEALLPPRIRERSLVVVRRVLGWDGGAGSTLEVAGQEFGLTRERIRQIVSKSLEGWSMPATSFLNRAIEAISHDAPCFAERAEALLLEQKIVCSPMRIEGILATARVLDIDVPWQIVRQDSSRVVCDIADGERHQGLYPRGASCRISHFGMTTKSYVAAALNGTLIDFADLCCSLTPDSSLAR